MSVVIIRARTHTRHRSYSVHSRPLPSRMRCASSHIKYAGASHRRGATREARTQKPNQSAPATSTSTCAMCDAWYVPKTKTFRPLRSDARKAAGRNGASHTAASTRCMFNQSITYDVANSARANPCRWQRWIAFARRNTHVTKRRTTALWLNAVYVSGFTRRAANRSRLRRCADERARCRLFYERISVDMCNYILVGI